MVADLLSTQYVAPRLISLGDFATHTRGAGSGTLETNAQADGETASETLKNGVPTEDTTTSGG